MTLQPNDCWNTPGNYRSAIFQFMPDYFDPCPANPDFDGLEVEWKQDCYINPPYSETLKAAFIAKAIKEYDDKSYYWHNTARFLWMFNYANSKDLCKVHEKASAVLIPFVRVRFKPGHPDLVESSPRYNNIMILWGSTEGFKEAFGELGYIYYNRPTVGDKE